MTTHTLQTYQQHRFHVNALEVDAVFLLAPALKRRKNYLLEITLVSNIISVKTTCVIWVCRNTMKEKRQMCEISRLKRIRLMSHKVTRLMVYGLWISVIKIRTNTKHTHQHTKSSCPRWLGLYAVCPHLLPAASSDSEREITARQVPVNVNCVRTVWRRRLQF